MEIKSKTQRAYPFNQYKTMKIKQIAIIIILAFSVQPMFAQLEDPTVAPYSPVSQKENTEQKPDPVTPSEQQEKTVEGQNQDTEEITPINTEVTTTDDVEQDGNPQQEKTEVEQQDDPSEQTPSKWEGKRRIFKLVNDHLLETDEVVTTLIMLAGDAKIRGTVTGNVLIIGGNVELGPEAQVKGMIHVIGGNITGNLESSENFRVSNHWRILPAAAHVLMHPQTIWDISKHRNFQLTSIKFGLFLVTYLLIAFAFPRPINVLSTMLTDKPTANILFSLLMLVLIPAFFWVMILSIVGFPLLILCLCLIVPMALIGMAAIFYTLGSTLLAGRLKPLAVIFGFVPYFMATEIPHIDWVTFLLFNTIGIGLCIRWALGITTSQNKNKNTHWSERVLN